MGNIFPNFCIIIGSKCWPVKLYQAAQRKYLHQLTSQENKSQTKNCKNSSSLVCRTEKHYTKQCCHQKNLNHLQSFRINHIPIFWDDRTSGIYLLTQHIASKTYFGTCFGVWRTWWLVPGFGFGVLQTWWILTLAFPHCLQNGICLGSRFLNQKPGSFSILLLI